MSANFDSLPDETAPALTDKVFTGRGTGAGAERKPTWQKVRDLYKTYFDTLYTSPASIPPAAITSALNPTTLVFKERGIWMGLDLIDPDFVVGKLPWNTANTVNFISYGGVETDSRVVNGVLRQPGSSSAAFPGFSQAVSFDAPFVAVTVPIHSSFGSGTADAITIGVQNAKLNQTRTGLTATWDRVAGTVYIAKYIAGTSTTLATATIALTPPFELGLSIAGLSAVVMGRFPGGDWFTITRVVLTAASVLDYRDPANLANLKFIELFVSSAGNSGANFEYGMPQWGYLMGVDGLTDKPVTFTDGTPIQHGSEQFMVYCASHVPGSASEAIPTANFQIMAVDPTKGYMRTQAKIYTLRNGLIQGENGGACVYDPITQDYIYIIPSWGNFHNFTDFEVHMYLYRRKGFPSGVIVLSGGTQMTVPTATSEYDPDLRFIGGLWYLTYAWTNLINNWNDFSSVLASSPDLSTWTLVNKESHTGSGHEGQKFFKLGGVQYVLASNYTTQLVYDMTLTQLGSFALPATVPVDGDSTHACLHIYRDGPYQRVFWILFDSARYDDFNYTWGRVHFLEATTKQTGHDFPVLPVLDIGVGSAVQSVRPTYPPTAASLVNPMTTAGDIIVGGSSGIPTRGTLGSGLSLSGGVLSAPGGVTYPTTFMSAALDAGDTLPGSSQSIAGQAFVTILCPEVTDTGSNYDPSTGIYTVPSTGIYVVMSKVRVHDDAQVLMSYGQGVHTSNADGDWVTWKNTEQHPTATGEYLGDGGSDGSTAGLGHARNGSVNFRVDSFTAGDQLRLFAFCDTTSSTYIQKASLIIYRLF